MIITSYSRLGLLHPSMLPRLSNIKKRTSVIGKSNVKVYTLHLRRSDFQISVNINKLASVIGKIQHKTPASFVYVVSTLKIEFQSPYALNIRPASFPPSSVNKKWTLEAAKIKFKDLRSPIRRTYLPKSPTAMICTSDGA